MQIRSIAFLTCLSAACVSASSADQTDLLQKIPPCAVSCINQGAVNLSPLLVGTSSICRNETFEANAASCVLMQCPYTDQIKVAHIKAEFCEGVPFASRSWDIAIVGLVCAPIALIAVALRCYSRYSKWRRLGFDDWLAVAAGLVLTALVVVTIYNSMINGYGRHYWDLDPSRIRDLLKMFYITELLYVSTLTLVKASMLVLYLRVFTPRWFFVADVLVLCVVVLAGLGLMFALVFQCYPISGVWERSRSSQCLNINTLAYASAAISVGLDVIILILPLPVLIRLKMNFKKKLSLVVMFSLGSLACITSGVRLKYLVASATSNDPAYLPLTGDNALLAIWSFVEICVALICACLPAMRALLSSWFPSIFDLTSTSTVNLKELPPSRTPDRATSYYLSPPPPKSKSVTTFVEKVGPSYNKRVIVVEYPEQPTYNNALLAQASTRSSEIFPQGLSHHFPQLSPGRTDSDTYNPPQQTYHPESLSAQIGIDSHSRIKSKSNSNSETKIWINPRFDSDGNLLDFQGAAPSPGMSYEDSVDLHYSIPTSESSLWALEGPRVSDDSQSREEMVVEEDEDEEERRQRTRDSHALYTAEEGIIVRPVGVALPMSTRRPRYGTLQRGSGFQRTVSPIPPEMGTDMF